jgi:hypothetical protein
MASIDNPGTSPLVEVKLEWGPIIAGAFCAAALAFVLHSFAAAIGLAVTSTAPTWRDASFALVFSSGLYLILAAVVSYGFGGYVAAHLRSRIASAATDEREFRDGMHGLIVWALATLVTALIAIVAVQALPRLAAPSGSASIQSGSIAGENVIAYDLDRLLRSDSRGAGSERNLSSSRAEAARILMTASGHRGVLPDDRAYLVRLVSATTGLGPAEAQARVNDVISRANQDIDRARHVGIIMAFMIGAAALLGALMAWFASTAAGRHRDGVESLHHFWDWSRPVTRI